MKKWNIEEREWHASHGALIQSTRSNFGLSSSWANDLLMVCTLHTTVTIFFFMARCNSCEIISFSFFFSLQPPSQSSFTAGLVYSSSILPFLVHFYQFVGVSLSLVCFSDYTFADVENLEHCAKYLNQSLVTFGFPASLDLFANDPVRILFVSLFSLF